ncbi:hypothetical protein SAMN05421770_107214 [Granulicella rosea]|uniref:Uncharacterized protein n=1 Tax=Granulicella rosea TaxID=474952 RepID=A0A239LQZ8_9BACT|nr:hypothetical protein [Granulicella rosea]SNT32805.1 hypothetical protein SAMN05421770_107214 [Granulicella rosea]
MAIDKSGTWWVGSEPQDIGGFLEAYSAKSYKTDLFRLSTCKCGGTAFSLLADEDEGCAQRICARCGEEHFLCDSEDYLEDATLEAWECVECEGAVANVGVGFSLYEDGEIRWLYVGARCAACGMLGCYSSWKVAYAPSKQLIEQA